MLGVLAQRAAQRVDGLGLASGVQVIERQRNLAAGGVQLEELLERGVGILATAERGQGLAELLVRQRQARFEPDGPLEARHGFLEPLLQRQHAAEVLVQVREIRLQRDRQTHGLFGLGVPALLAERIAEQAQVLDAAGIAFEVGAADFLGAERSVGLHRLERGGEARVLWRHGSGHGLHRAALMARERGLGESVIGVLCRSRAGCPDCP